jgi:L-malate glycosyltransferase
MLRVCHLISGDLWAGAEVMAYHLIKGLHGSAGLEISLILLNEGRLARECRVLGIKPYILDESRLTFLEIARNIRKFLIANPPDIIHSHRYKENILAYLSSRNISKIKLVSTQHGLPEANGRSEPLAGRIKSGINFYVLRQCFNRVVAVSEDIRTLFINERSFSENKVMVVHNGVQIPGDISENPGRGPFVIGSSGRLFPVKDYPLMIEVARALVGEMMVIFTLAGEGPERDRLEHAIRECGLGQRFRLEGHLDDMDCFYRGLSLYINTSVHEGIPMTILEAMARGLPIIAPKVGGIPEVVQDGVEGFLVRGRDPLAFAEKCLLLYKNRDIWERMSIAARRKAAKAFSVEKMVEAYLRIYYALTKS